MTSLLGIGEFAREAGLSVSAIRFYADRGLLTPAETDPSSRYRSFRSDQIAAGRLIRDLRRMGIPLAQVEQALVLSTREIATLIEAHIDQLEQGVNEARSIASVLGAAPPENSVVESIQVPGSELARGLVQVLPFASSDLEQPHLMTVLVEARQGTLRLVATDRHRLAVRELVTLEPGEEISVLLAAATARLWGSQLMSAGEVTLRLDGSSLVASGPDVTLVAAGIPASFPDYETFLAAPARATTIVCDRRRLVDAFESFDDAMGAVLLSADANGLRFTRRESVTEVPAETLGSDVDVVINATLGLECVTSSIGPEVVVEIENDPLRPVLFRSATDGTYVARLMPVRLTGSS